MIILDNKKLHNYIVSKDTLVKEGRKISGELDKVQKDIEVCQKEEQKITGKIKPNKEFKKEGDALVSIMDTSMKRLEVLGKLIEKHKLDAVPKELKDKHFTLMAKKEKLERDRNKIFLKVQKIKDRLIPLVQKLVRPLLKEKYDDVETAKAINDKVYINTFNHLEDWKKKFGNK